MKLPWRPRSLFGKLMFTHLFVVIFTLFVIGFFLTYLMERYFFGMREWELASQAENAAFLIQEDLMQDDIQAIRKTAGTLAVSLDAKIRILDRNGDLIAVLFPDNELQVTDPGDEGVGLEHNEITQVLEGNLITKKVYGPRLQRLLVAAPVFKTESEEQSSDLEQAEVIGAIALSVPLRGLQETIARISLLTFYSGIIAAFIAGALAFSLAKKITKPLQDIKRTAMNMAEGKLYQKIEVDDNDEIGQVAHTFNIAVDQVEKTIQEQKRLETFRRNLVANISHELRGPLTSMRGFTEVMIDGLLKEEEKDKYLKIILDHTIHLSRLVDDLMELSHLESGNLRLEREEIMVGDVAEFSFQSIDPAAREKEVKMCLQIEPSLPTVWADQSRLHEILRNLLENALQHTPSGGEVILKVYSSQNCAVFEVRDTGDGIPEEDQPYIWERFYKVDKSRNRTNKGTGLGLAITKQLVELHGGNIELSSTLGRGSIFRVSIPLTG